MELQKFIAEILKAYITGVKEAQIYAAENDAKINPSMKRDSIVRESQDNTEVLDVEFDVAVTSSEGSEARGGIGIMVAYLGMGAQAKTDTTSREISRIKFKIPVALPIQWDKQKT